jgi:hypothetical protein
LTEISLKSLKNKAIEGKFPEPVKSLILSEPDTLEVKEYIAKTCTWERILKIPKEAKNDR